MLETTIAKSKPSDDSLSRDEIAIMVARLTTDVSRPRIIGNLEFLII
jgi:hypothetical protein